MYEDIAKLLRDCCRDCKLWDGNECCLDGDCTGKVRLQAADVIEELSRIERDFRQYISDQVKREKGVYACCYCKNREAFDEDYGCGCDHADCDGANEWEYGTPRKENEGCNAAGTERTTTDCEDYMSHLPTNADRIRAMTDEELASLLMYFADDTDEIDEKDYDAFGNMEWRGRMLRWLKQEVTD